MSRGPSPELRGVRSGAAIHHRWRALAQSSPRALALVDEHGVCHDRGQVLEAARDWAVRLGDNATWRSRKLALVAGNGPGWLAAFLGMLELGAVPLLLDKGEPAPRQLELAHALGASALWQEDRLVALPLRPRLRRSDLCLVKVTSGSTGRARGLAFTHAQMEADGRQVCSSMGIGPGDRNLAVIPFGHSYGLGNLVLPLLLQGSPVICSPSPLPSVLGECCQTWKPTVFPAVPTLLRALVLSGLESSALASLRLVVSAGAPLGPEAAQAFEQRFGRPVHNFYGSSETGGITFDRRGDAAATGRSVGSPLEGVVLEPVRGGRFRVRSAAVMGRGGFVPPDRAEFLAGGELRLLGRVGRLVKIGGRRLDLAGLEAEIAAFAGVRGVVAAPHPQHADKLAALVCCDLEARALRALLAARLASWKVPERLRVVSELPLSPRGKVDRAACLRLLG